MTPVERTTSRRHFLGAGTLLTGLAAAGTLTSCSDSRATTATAPAAGASAKPNEFSGAKIDWKQHSGTTITLAALAHPWYTAIQPLLPSFTELTGIKVTPSLLGEDQYVSKIAVELSGGASTPDVFMVNQFGQAAGSGWLAPLDGYLSNSKLTDPAWYSTADFFPGARSFGSRGGKQLALPITSEVEMLFVRTDLVKKIPATLEDLRAAAAAAASGNIAGFGSRAVSNANETPWPFAGFAFTEGGAYLDTTGKPVLSSAANIAALSLYTDLLTRSGPKGVSSWGYLENNQAMEQGRLALWTDSSSLLGGLKDPKTSKYAAHIDAYPFPSHGGKSSPNVFYWTVGINAKSANPDAAWLFLQWATSKPISQAAGLIGASPARASSWQAASASTVIGTANAARVLASLRAVSSARMAAAWQNSKWSQVANVLAQEVNAAITGTSPAAALKSAQSQALSILA